MSRRWIVAAAGALALMGAGGLSAVALAELQGDGGVGVCANPSGVLTLAGSGGCRANELSLTVADVALVADLEERLDHSEHTLTIVGKRVDDVERMITIVVNDLKEQVLAIQGQAITLQDQVVTVTDDVADLRDRVAKLEAERR